jgi:hypothetical protein
MDPKDLHLSGAIGQESAHQQCTKCLAAKVGQSPSEALRHSGNNLTSRRSALLSAQLRPIYQGRSLGKPARSIREHSQPQTKLVRLFR